jgi:hypothetical protein
MAVGKPDGTWYTTTVEISALTPFGKIEDESTKQLQKELEKQHAEVAFTTVHHFDEWEDEDAELREKIIEAETQHLLEEPDYEEIKSLYELYYKDEPHHILQEVSELRRIKDRMLKKR